MSASAGAFPSQKISKVLELCEPEFVLGTTYTLSLAFFESLAFPRISKTHLKRCVLLCDPVGFERAVTEAPALRAATRDYMVAVAPASGFFHAKVWVLLGQKDLVVLAGSGNMTQPGFIDNLELFDAVHLQSGGPGSVFGTDVLGWVQGLVGLWKGVSDNDLLVLSSLKAITAQVGAFCKTLTPNTETGTRLLSSFGGPFPQQLKTLCNPDVVRVAAPYFGNSAEGLRGIQETLKPRKLEVFPALHRDGTVDLPLAAARGVPNVTVRALDLPAAQRKRFAHLKLYGLESSAGDAWLFTSSVNCTTAALEGPNVEAGILRRVARAEVQEYFRGEPMASVDAASHWSQNATAGWVTLWSTDMGDHIAMELAPAHYGRAPFSEVVIELRSGQRTAKATHGQVFGRGGTERIWWREFGDFRQRHDGCAVLEMQALDRKGDRVRGMCLVDDFATLTSDPMHRSAWRAAAALLSAEGLPEYSDLAALFTLADVLSEDADDPDEDVTGARYRKSVAGSTNEAMKDKTAVWPPRPLQEDAIPSGPMGHGAGDLIWFNRILALFVQGPTEQAVASAGDEPEDGKSGAKAAPAPVEAPPVLVRAASRLWDRGYGSFTTMRSRLEELVITERHAARVWGPATFVFLGVLNVAAALRRSSALASLAQSPATLSRDWLATLFAPRDQGDDYIDDTWGRYFPSVASDLATRFKVHPHPEICAVIAIAFAHVHAAAAQTQQQDTISLHWLQFVNVAGDLLPEATRDPSHLEHVWNAYFQDGTLGWPDVKESLDRLMGSSWNDHPGFRDVLAMTGLPARVRGGQAAVSLLPEHLRQRASRFLASGAKVIEADPLTEYCPNERCPKQGISIPELERLRSMRPVICPHCAHLLVPTPLYEEYRRAPNGSRS